MLAVGNGSVSRSWGRKPSLLDDLASALHGLDLRTLKAKDPGLARKRDRLVETIRTSLLPRLEDPSSPLLVVFAGPTGSGKSTLINSVVGLDLSVTGPRRPTTKVPLFLVSDPGSVHELEGGQLVLGAAPVLQQMSFVDTPDIDSTDIGHRVVAEGLIDRADVVVFITSALRYGDLVPWEVLRRAMSRGAVVIVVMNRLDSRSAAAADDFSRMLRSEGIIEPLLKVPEYHLPADGHLVPSIGVSGLRRRLLQVVEDRRRTREEVLLRVTEGLIAETRALLVDLSRVLPIMAEEEERVSELHASSEGPPRLDQAELAPWPRGLFGPRTRVFDEWVTRLGLALRAEIQVAVRKSGPTPVGLAELESLIAQSVDGWLDMVRHLCQGRHRWRRAFVEVVKTVACGAATDSDEDLVADANLDWVARFEALQSQLADRAAKSVRPGYEIGDLNEISAMAEGLVHDPQPADV